MIVFRELFEIVRRIPFPFKKFWEKLRIITASTTFRVILRVRRISFPSTFPYNIRGPFSPSTCAQEILSLSYPSIPLLPSLPRFWLNGWWRLSGFPRSVKDPWGRAREEPIFSRLSLSSSSVSLSLLNISFQKRWLIIFQKKKEKKHSYSRIKIMGWKTFVESNDKKKRKEKKVEEESDYSSACCRATPSKLL